MQVLVVAGIALAVVLGVVLFVVLPALAIIKARPEMRRMMRVRVDDPPINLGRAFGHWLERNDRRLAQEHRDARDAQQQDPNADSP